MYKLRIYWEVFVYHLTWWFKALNYNSTKEIEKVRKKFTESYKHYKQFVNVLKYDGVPDSEYNFGSENYVVRNNKWGIFKLKKPSSYIQDVIDYPAWFYETPIKNHGVLGYPEVKYKKVIPIDSIQNLWVNWSALFHNNKMKYNLAFDFWLLSEYKWDWKKVKHEIMIWEDYHVSRPNGKRMGTVTFNGNDYAVYSGFIDKSKEKSLGIDGWILTTFVRKKPQRDIHKSGNINLRWCLDEMKNLGILNSDDYETLHLHNIELGTEVYNSVGICFIDEFDVNYWDTTK